MEVLAGGVVSGEAQEFRIQFFLGSVRNSAYKCIRDKQFRGNKKQNKFSNGERKKQWGWRVIKRLCRSSLQCPSVALYRGMSI
ncbi:hypothetical protein V6N13_077915 [Hibiscus sabdariffa]|uniref:Uncharacterized protein n=1 Tax=Hibiscus sabdariffa TaxID=183260 RepID=A0ABR2RMU5_9ROSI